MTFLVIFEQMSCFARFCIICTIQKTWKTPMEACYLSTMGVFHDFLIVQMVPNRVKIRKNFGKVLILYVNLLWQILFLKRRQLIETSPKFTVIVVHLKNNIGSDISAVTRNIKNWILYINLKCKYLLHLLRMHFPIKRIQSNFFLKLIYRKIITEKCWV